jgi:predicted nucleic acid-binding Zn ribbon protein
MEKRKCLECGYEFFGRVDKKFCSDQCRNTYNNRLKRDVNNYVRNINNILRKNRRILESLNPKGKAKVHKTKLMLKGFNFDYFTNVYRTKSGKIYYFCYEQGYLQLKDDYYALVIKSEYVDQK